MNPIFTGKVENQTLVLDSPNKFRDYLFTLQDKRVDIVVGIPKKQRSNQENRYYWGVVIKLLSDHLGYTDEEMHDALKMLFLKDNSREIPTLRSTTELTTIEFEKYLENIKMWAANIMNVYIPDPNEVEI